MALPWSLWGGGILRKTFWTGPTRELRLLAAIWAVVILAFFSLPASKLVGYAADAAAAGFPAGRGGGGRRRNEHDTITPRLVRISAGAGAFICVLAVGIAGHNARGSAEPLAR